MKRAALVRGAQVSIAITLATLTWFLYDSIRKEQGNLAAGFTHVSIGWLCLGAVLALQEGVCGGLRIFVLCRVLSRELKIRTAIISEFVLMFCAGVTPGQAGAPASQVAVLVHGGMSLADASTAELITALCTVTFFLFTALTVYVLRATGLLVLAHGAEIDWLLRFSVLAFGVGFVALVLCGAYPPLLKGLVRLFAPAFGALARLVARPLTRIPRLRERAQRFLDRPGAARDRVLAYVDEMHEGFSVYWRRGKLAYLGAQLLTFAFFLSRFAVAYCILRGLGVETTPDHFVAVGPPFVQVIIIQAVLNFALYLSPVPGASGVAEAGASALMSPWLRPPYELPFLVLWRVLTLFLCMFVGGLYVFRYFGTDLLEERIAKNEAEKLAVGKEAA